MNNQELFIAERVRMFIVNIGDEHLKKGRYEIKKSNWIK